MPLGIKAQKAKLDADIARLRDSYADVVAVLGLCLEGGGRATFNAYVKAALDHTAAFPPVFKPAHQNVTPRRLLEFFATLGTMLGDLTCASWKKKPDEVEDKLSGVYWYYSNCFLNASCVLNRFVPKERTKAAVELLHAAPDACDPKVLKKWEARRGSTYDRVAKKNVDFQPPPANADALVVVGIQDASGGGNGGHYFTLAQTGGKWTIYQGDQGKYFITEAELGHNAVPKIDDFFEAILSPAGQKTWLHMAMPPRFEYVVLQ